MKQICGILMLLCACSTPPGGGATGTSTDTGKDPAKADSAASADADAGAVADTPSNDDAIGQDAANLLDAPDLSADDAEAPPEDVVQTDWQGLDDLGSSDDASGDCTPGSLEGIACAPKVGVSVSFAVIAFDQDAGCSGAAPVHIEVTADAKGHYFFAKLPPGPAILTMTKGSFKTSSPIAVLPGKKLDFTAQNDPKRCFSATAGKIAVIQGDADDLGKLLDGLGLKYDSFDSGTTKDATSSAAAKLMKDLSALQKYDVLLINCSSTAETLVKGIPAITANLQAFVQAGHSLYASDWAWSYVETAFPDAIDFYGADASYAKSTAGPSATAGPRQGPGPTFAQKTAGTPPFTTQGDLLDAGLAAVLAKKSTTVYQDLGTWAVIQAPGKGTTAIMEGKVASALGDWGTVPLVVSFPVGKGHVVYTSFHNIAQADAGGSVADIQAILNYLVFTL